MEGLWRCPCCRGNEHDARPPAALEVGRHGLVALLGSFIELSLRNRANAFARQGVVEHLLEMPGKELALDAALEVDAPNSSVLEV